MNDRGWIVRPVLLLAAGLTGGAAWAAEPLTPEEAARFQDLDARHLQTFSNADLADYLALRQKDLAVRGEVPNPADEVGQWATKAIGQPFRLGAARFDYTEGDCVVAVERAVAMALARDWDSFYKLSERLRHKDGRVDVLEQNYFTLLQWVPENSFVFVEITADLGPTSTFVHAAYPKSFYRNLSFGDDDTPKGRAKATAKAAKVASVPPKITTTETFIERKNLGTVLRKLRTGDIVLFISELKVPSGKTLDCDHMGVVTRHAGEPFVVQSTRSGVALRPLARLVETTDFVAGVKFLRLRDDVVRRVQDELGRLTNVAVPAPVEQDAAVRAAHEARK